MWNEIKSSIAEIQQKATYKLVIKRFQKKIYTIHLMTVFNIYEYL